MNYWIFSVKQKWENGKLFTAQEIYQQRMADRFWGISSNAPNRSKVGIDDKVIIYLGAPDMLVAGTATIKEIFTGNDQNEIENLAHGTHDVYWYDTGVWLDQIQIWDDLVKFKNLIQNLSFIKRKDTWGSYLQGGVTRIPKEDYEFILNYYLNGKKQNKNTFYQNLFLRVKKFWVSFQEKLNRTFGGKAKSSKQKNKFHSSRQVTKGQQTQEEENPEQQGIAGDIGAERNQIELSTQNDSLPKQKNITKVESSVAPTRVISQGEVETAIEKSEYPNQAIEEGLLGVDESLEIKQSEFADQDLVTSINQQESVSPVINSRISDKIDEKEHKFDEGNIPFPTNEITEILNFQEKEVGEEGIQPEQDILEISDDSNGGERIVNNYPEQVEKLAIEGERSRDNLSSDLPIVENYSEAVQSKIKNQPLLRQDEEREWKAGRYYQLYKLTRLRFIQLSDDQVDKFIQGLSEGELSELPSLNINSLENYFFETLKRVQLIGELPISRDLFFKLCEMIRDDPDKKRRRNPKEVPPSLFLIMMVFCARYSNVESRNFWEPYCRLVWDRDTVDQYFQQQCRDHFIACRHDLQETLGIEFRINRLGDVVLPVYQHTIIPYHLMDNFAEWIVQHYENFLGFDSTHLVRYIKAVANETYMPNRLIRFMTDKDTDQSAAELIKKMSDAIILYKETGSPGTVEKVIIGPIEKSVWKAIYQYLSEDTEKFGKLSQRKPSLNWIWLPDEVDLALCLSNIQSPLNRKPNTLYVSKERNFKNASYRPGLSPWQNPNIGWLLDKLRIPSEKLIDNDEIFIVSDLYELDRSPDQQEDNVIYSTRIPAIDAPLILFWVSPHRKVATQKETIDRSGNWVVFSKSDVKFVTPEGNQIQGDDIYIPTFLRKRGYQFSGNYQIDLPINVIKNGEEIKFVESVDSTVISNYEIYGEDQVPGLSEFVSPLFQSSKIFIDLLFTQQVNYRNTWLTLSKPHSERDTYSFAELVRMGVLTHRDGNVLISLTPLLTYTGSYRIDVIQGLRSLLEGPIDFGYLKNIQVIPPSLDQIFSPEGNPFQVRVQGAKQWEFILPEDARVQQKKDFQIITWKLHKEAECNCTMNNDQGDHINLGWKIDRVSAWIDGGFNKNLVKNGQENNVILNVRGKPHQEAGWFITSGSHLPFTLNNKGVYAEKLQETQLRDLLRSQTQVVSHVDISIEDLQWNVFRYLKIPEIKFTRVYYADRELRFEVNQTEILEGNYQLLVRKRGIGAPIKEKELRDLKEKNTWKVDLDDGYYSLEILVENSRIALSEEFICRIIQPKHVLKAIPTPKVTPEIRELSNEEIYNLLTSDNTTLELLSEPVNPSMPAIDQIMKINDQSTWFIDGRVEDGIINLLPFWAVTKYPFRFVEQKFHKTLIIYPEETALGGIVGKGYSYLKVRDKKEKVYAAWKPGGDEGHIKLFLCFRDNQVQAKVFNEKSVSSWPLYNLRPAYQCIDCGELLGSGDGGFPPDIFNQHLHGRQRRAYDQFVDVRHRESLDNTLTLYQEETLDYSDSVKKTFQQGYLTLLSKQPNLKREGALSLPISTNNNLDFAKGVTELFFNYQQDMKRKFIDVFIAAFDELHEFKFYYHQHTDRLIQFAILIRLAESLKENDPLGQLPEIVLYFCMALRLKANRPNEFIQLLQTTGVQEERLIELLRYGREAIPKLIEWGIAWSEIFFVHALS